MLHARCVGSVAHAVGMQWGRRPKEFVACTENDRQEKSTMNEEGDKRGLEREVKHQCAVALDNCPPSNPLGGGSNKPEQRVGETSAQSTWRVIRVFITLVSVTLLWF